MRIDKKQLRVTDGLPVRVIAAFRFLDRSQRHEIGIVLFIPVIDAEVDSAVPETLQRLAQVHHAPLTLAAGLVEIHFGGNQFLLYTRLVDGAPGGVNDAGAAVAANADTVDIEDIGLKHGRRGAGDIQFHVAVDRVGKHRMENDLRAPGHQGACGFRQPHVITDGQAKPSGIFDVEYQAIIAAGHSHFVGSERKKLAVSAYQLTLWADDGSRIENQLLAELKQRTGNKPDLVP